MANYLVRSLYRSVVVPSLSPPNDTAHLKIFYPAAPSHSPEENDTGAIGAAREGGPFPVVIIMAGINVGPEGLFWLARRLCAHGLIVVTYGLIGEEFPGVIGLTPGLDIEALKPGIFGTRPSARALLPTLEELGALHAHGLLQGRIDLTRIIFGGHSAGGSVALLNANPDWFAAIVGCFAYGAHTAAATMLGYQPQTFHPIDPRVGVLLMGGAADGVMGQSAGRYGVVPDDGRGRMIATFERAISREAGDCSLAILKGANHFSICDPQDLSSGRAFLDGPETLANVRDVIGDLVETFVLQALNFPDTMTMADMLIKHEAALSASKQK